MRYKSRMKNLKAFLFMAFLSLPLLALGGCGGGSQQTTTYWHPERQIPTRGLPESQAAALRTYVYCGAENCNPSVGMLISTTTARVGTCTASLIGDGEIAVTNSHCIPDDLKQSDGADCGDRLYLFFPKVGNAPAVRADCAKVLHASDISGKEKVSADYAFIRLKAPVSRPVIKFSDGGFESSKAYHLAKVDPTESNGAFMGRLENTDCVATYPTVLTPSANHPQSPLTSFTSCKIEHGNSGSPILDDLGQIRGVIQAKFEPDTLLLIGLQLKGAFLDGVPADVGIGTNLACVDFPAALPAHSIPAACTNVPTSEEEEKSQRAISTAILDRMTREALAQIRGTIPALLEDVFEWTLASQKGGDMVIVPKCFKPAAGWIHHYKNIFGSTKSSATVKVSIPFWKARFGYDQNLRFDGRLEPYATGAYASVIKFDPKEFSEKGSTEVRLAGKDADGSIFSSGIRVSDVLSSCPTH